MKENTVFVFAVELKGVKPKIEIFGCKLGCRNSNDVECEHKILS